MGNPLAISTVGQHSVISNPAGKVHVLDILLEPAPS
jgi:hypothetical protein